MLDRLGGYYLEAIEKKLKLPLGGHNRRDVWTIGMGNIPTLVVPPVFGGVWVGAVYRSTLRMGPLSIDDWVAVSIAIVVIAVAVAFNYHRMRHPGGRRAHREANLMDPLERALNEWER
jgi:hypothetical protein